MKKSGTQMPSFRPLSTLRPCRIRDGTRSSVTTAWPSAASVQASMIESTSASTRLTPGSTPTPTRVPAAIVSGRPMPSSRSRHRELLAQRRQRDPRGVGEEDERQRRLREQLTRSLPILRSTRPNTGPASKPADVKKIAGVTSDRSSRPEMAEKPSSTSATVASSQAPNASPPLLNQKTVAQSSFMLTTVQPFASARSSACSAPLV